MLVTYIIGSLALIIKPGPDLTCTIATALADGKARATTLMIGLILAAGVATIFTHHPAVMLSIQIAGTAYIAYLAFGAFREAWRSFKSTGAGLTGAATARGWRLVGRGILMSMSNPLTILFFLAFLPNFTHEGSSIPPSVQTLLLGTLFCALVPFVYLPFIFAADFFRSRLLGSSKATACLKIVSAILLTSVVAILCCNVAKQV